MSPVEWAGDPAPKDGGEVAPTAVDAAPWYKRYAKALAAFLATLTPTAVFQILADNGVHVNGWVNVVITVLLGTLAVRQVRNAV